MRNRALLIIFTFGMGCMDGQPNYEECVDIETARCNLRDKCQEQGQSASFNEEFSDFDKDTCIAYAKEHCRTRRIGRSDDLWDRNDVDQCIAAIEKNVPCDTLKKDIDETETLAKEQGKCIFIEAPPPKGDTPTEAGTDTQSSPPPNSTNAPLGDAGA